jgi:uncharacterized protein YjbI with pentapeptide repeats
MPTSIYPSLPQLPPPRDFSQPQRSENNVSKKVDKLLAVRPGQTGDNVSKQIDTLLAAYPTNYSFLKKDIVALTQKLITTKHLFPQESDASGSIPFRFDLRERVGKLVLSRAGVKHYLNEISPSLADNENFVRNICQIANYSVPGKHAKADRKDAMLKDIHPHETPVNWPTEAMLYVLRVGLWDHINLTGAVLERRDDLRGMQWKHAILNGAKFRGSDMRNSDLSYSTAIGTDFSWCDMSHVLLVGATMENAVADNTIFQYADMTGVIAKDAFFLKAEFEKAILKNTNFDGAHLEYAKRIPFEEGLTVNDARLHDASIGWGIHRREFDDLNQFVKCQLDTINTIPLHHRTLHNKLIWLLIETTGAEYGRLPNMTALTHTLLSKKRCWVDNRLTGFIDKTILPPLLTRWNGTAIEDNEPSPEQVTRYITENKPGLDPLRYCGAISQLLADAEQSQRYDQRTALSSLLKTHSAIAPLAAEMEKQGLEPFEECSIFANPDSGSVMVYPTADLKALAEGARSPYNGYYFVRDARGNFFGDLIPDFDTIKACTVPPRLYKAGPAPAAAVRLFSYIFDNEASKDRLIHALSCKDFRHLPPEHADKFYMLHLEAADISLRGHLEKFLDPLGGTSINMLQCRLFWEKFAGPEGSPLTNSHANIARMLLCLSALSIRQSSSAQFGIQNQSLDSMKMFAWACIYSAQMFDPSLLSKAEVQKTMGYSVQELVKTHTCTIALAAQLSEKIRTKAKNDPALASCFEALYPQAEMAGTSQLPVLQIPAQQLPTEENSESSYWNNAQPAHHLLFGHKRPIKVTKRDQATSPLKPTPAARRALWQSQHRATAPDADAAKIAA